MSWRVATVVALRDQSPTARSIVLDVPGWPGHAAGQHVDVRLTAPDGYTAVRSYSIASAVDGDRVELTVEQLPDGEVSPYLGSELIVGDAIEIRGPIGGWFVWRPDQWEPIQLIAGGSGVVPLVAIARSHAAAGSRSPIRLLYSVREPSSVLHASEIEDLASRDGGLILNYAFTRSTPPGWDRPPGRVDAELLADSTWPAELAPTCYVCGPTSFVESVADLLVEAGHDPARVRTERFGPTGGTR
ncbi:MAG TPA: ferredoxin reductase [Jiangellaceae bacterium]|nr:ferredoxin reductase [Jiangellaceae bacterium]